MRRLRYRRLQKQTVIPSQDQSRIIPYSDRFQADIAQFAPMRGTFPQGYTRPEPWVVTQFDARPINAIDFVKTFTAAEQAGPADSLTFSFAVPAGRTAILRNLSLRVFMSDLRRNVLTAQPTAVLTAGFAIDNNAVDQYNNIRVDDAICGVIAGATSDVLWQMPLQVPLYFIAPEGSTVSLTIVNSTVGTDINFAAPVLTGNLLLSEGVNPSSEPGTKCAVPVWGADRRETPVVIRRPLHVQR